MKGIVFTEFLEMVERQYGLSMADQIIDAAQLDNDGAYTAVGTYDHHELLSLVQALSEVTGIGVPNLVEAFGEYLFERFTIAFPAFIQGSDSALAFLLGVDRYIHVEVRKLYPDAELPTFTYETELPDKLVMTYQSRRPLADLAEGLIRGCIKHYGDNITLARQDLHQGDFFQTRFTLSRGEA